MRIYKKVMAVGLSASIAASSLQASWGDDMSDGNFMNVTPGGTYDINGRDIYTTSSVYYRFGPQAVNYEAIYHISPPEIEGSCAGFNLKGLFVSILGLDRISKMLKSAGASFAWGVVVGLVYSLPGIFSSFKMLNTWAKKIMQLMQNACNAGQKIGRALADSSGVSDSVKGAGDMFSGWVSHLNSEEAQNATENPESTEKKGMLGSLYDKFSSGSGDLMSDSEDSGTPLPEELAKVFRNLVLSGYTNTPATKYMRNLLNLSLAQGGSSSVADFFTGILSTKNVNPVGIGKFYLNLTKNDAIEKKLGIVSTEEQINQDMNFFKAVVISNSVEKKVLDYDATKKAIEAYYTAYKNSGGNISTTTTTSSDTNTTTTTTTSSDTNTTTTTTTTNTSTETVTPEQAASIISKSFETNGLKVSKKDKSEKGNSGNSNIKQFGKFVAYSFLKTTDEKAKAIAKNIFNMRGLSFAVIGAKEGATTSNMLYFVSESGENTKLFGLPTDEGGTLKNNAAAFMKTKAGADFYSVSKSFINDIVDNDKTVNAAAESANIPILMGISQDFIRIIKQTPTNKREPLKEGLAKLNVCLYGEAILDYAERSFYRKSDKGTPFSIDDQGTMATASEISFPEEKAVSSETQAIQDKAIEDFKSGIFEAVLDSMESIPDIELTGKESTKNQLKIACSKLKKDIIYKIKQQDIENKRNAAKLTK